jgi:hypothetical protein
MIGLGHALSLALAPKEVVMPPFVGPLDALTSGLRDAWSVVRRPLSSYTGALVQIRRESDNDETLIYTGSNGMLDVVAAANFKGDSTLRVVTVFGVNGWKNLTQTTTANQPQLILTGGINGGPSVLKDGYSQYLLLDFCLQLGDSCYLIEQSLDPQPWQRGFTRNGWAGQEFLISSGTTNQGQFNMGTDVVPTLGTTDAVCEIFANTNGAPVRCWSNGVDVAPGATQNGSIIWLTQNTVFTSSYGNQLFAELGIWNYGFGDTDAAALWSQTNPANL